MLNIKIALVGRPNVGKSTLFNRLSTKTRAIVHDTPGVTRDRKYANAQIGPLEFTVIDTPGLEESEEDALEHRMMQQTISSIKEADLVCLIVDNKKGVTPIDKYFANMIRKNSEKHILIANKCEKEFYSHKEYFQLGFGEPVPISAEHGQGMVDLYEAIDELLNLDEIDDIDNPLKTDHIQIVIAGRPNSGKSTFVNAILGSDRMLTGPEAGITRESVEINFTHKSQEMKIIDTAGLRKRNNINEKLEKLSASDSIDSIKFANCVVLMIDATIALEQQDLNLANYTINEGRSLVIVINKWDLIEEKKEYVEEMNYRLEQELSQVKGVPIVYISAINSSGVNTVLDSCVDIYELWNKKLSTSKLNDWLNLTTAQHLPPLIKKLGRRLKLKYMTQIKTRPPTFRIFTNSKDRISESYERYLLNSLRNDFKLPGVPIRIYFNQSDNPYAKKKKKKKGKR